MSNTSFYLRSEKELVLRKTEIPIPYEYTLFPVNGRAIPVTKIDISNNMVTFSNVNTEYIIYEMGIIQEKTSNGWQTASSSYFDNNYPGIRVYKNNLFQSVINDIKSNIVNITSPRTYMLYGYDGEKRAVTIIKKENGYYRFFVEGIGGTDFHEITGLPIRSVNSAGLDLPILTYIIYKYDGYSQVTKEFFDNVYNNINNNTTKPQNDIRPDLYRDNTTQTYIRDLNLWITHLSSNRESRVFSIYKDNSRYNPPNLIFFAKVKQDYPLLINDNSEEEGVLFTIQGNVVKPLYAVYHNYISIWNPENKNSASNIPYEYRIYRRNAFLNFDKSVSSVLTNIEASNMIPIILSSTTNFNRINPTVDKFIITIPNDKPTNRIFVYQSGTNRLLHITYYIPKGTTQNVTINYSQGITSSITPVNPLPVPEFRLDGNKGGYVNGYGWDGNEGQSNLLSCEPGSIVNNIQTQDCCHPLVGMYFDCKNPYKLSESAKSPNGGWRGRSRECNYNTVTKNEGYIGMYAEAGKWVDKVIFRGADGTSKEIGCEGNFRGKSISDYNCPNGKIAGFFSRTDRLNDGGKDGIFAGLQAYCASPTIPKDTSTAISWSKNPQNPIEGGQEGSRKTYVCRAFDGDKWVPGKFHSNNCYYGNNGNNKVTDTSYELASANEPLVWRNKTDVPTEKKIEGGINGDNTVTYICRVNHLDMWIPGKEVSNDTCFFEYHGERRANTYQLLSRQ